MRRKNSLNKNLSILKWHRCQYVFSKLAIILSIIALATGCKGNLSGALFETETQFTVNGITLTSKSILQTTENGGSDSFSIVLESPPTSEVIISLQSSNIQEGSLSQNTLSFDKDNWNTKQTISVTGVDDAIQDGDLNYEVIFNPTTSNDPNYNGISLQSISVLNSDNDSAPQIDITDIIVLESTTSVTLNVSLTGSSALASSVQFNTEDISAIGGSDYTAASGTLTWNAGDTSVKTITINLLDDSVVEANETFRIRLSNEVNAGLLNTAAIVTITNDDSPPVFAGISSAITVSDTQIDLSWPSATDDSSASGNIIFRIYQATASGGQNFASPSYTTLPGAANYSVTGLVDSTNYFFVVRAEDEAGNIETNTVELNAATLDTTAPVVAITAPIAAATVNGAEVITFTDTEITNPQVSVDNSNWTSATSGTTTLSAIAEFAGLGDGGFTLYLRDIDASLNTGTDSILLTKDTAAPVVAITAPIAAATVNGAEIITFTDTEITSPQVSVDNSNWTSATSGTTTLSAIAEFAGLGDGAITLYLRDIDAAGNTGTHSISLTKDTTAPSVAITAPADTATVNGAEVITFTDTEITNPQVSVDNSNWTSATSGTSTLGAIAEFAGLGDGAITLYLRDIDAAGNTGTHSISLTKDTTAPSVAITAPADTAAVNGAEVITFTDTEITNPQVSVDNSNWTNATSGTTTLSAIAEFAGLGEAAFTLYLRDTDAVGNTGTHSISLTKDTTAPSVAITAPAAAASVNGTEVITFTDTELTNPQVSVDNTNWTNATSGTTTLSAIAEFAGLGEAAFTLYLRDTDTAGNTSTHSIALTKDTTPPAMTITYPIDSTNVLGTDNITYLQSEDTNAQVSVDNANWTNAQSEITTLSDIPEYLALPDGAFVLYLRGTDPAGNTSTNATINITKNESTSGPYITSAEYFDTNNNGRIDHVKITFSKTMTDSSFDGYNSAGTPNDQLHDSTTVWQIAGYSNVRLDTTDSIDGTLGEDDEVIWLAFDDIGSGGDTGAKPDLTAQDSKLVGSGGCYINTNPANCGNNLMADVNTADVIEVDKSRPIITSISGTVGSDTLKIYFSEAIDTLSGDDGCVTPDNNLSPGDFAFADNNTGFASSILNLTPDANGCDDSMVIATLNANLGTGDIGADSINPVLNEIYDPADNSANDTISVLIQNPLDTQMVITQNAVIISNATSVSDGTEIFDYGTLDFGSTASGDEFPIKKVTFKVENNASATDDLILTGNPVIMSDLTNFMITKKPADTSLPPGSFQEFEIAFTPIAAGTYNGTITIPSNDPNHPYTFTVTATSGSTVNQLVLGTDYPAENIVTSKDINWYFIDTKKGSAYQVQWGDAFDPGGYLADIIVDIYNMDFTSQLLDFGDYGFEVPFTFTAKKDGRIYISAYEYSDLTGDYQVKADEMIKFSPPPGAYDTAQQVNLSFGNTAATIYYTTDGTDPTNGSTAYTQPIAVNTNSNLKAIAYVGATPVSLVNSGYYAIPTLITLGADNNDSLLADEEKWYYFDATAGTSYEITWEDSFVQYNDSAFTADVLVSGYREDQTQSFFVNEDSGFTPPQIIFAESNERIYIKVKGFDAAESGSFNLRASVFSPVLLTSGTPVTNNLTAGRNDWYSSDQLQDTIVKFQWEDSLDQAATTYGGNIMVTAYSENSSLFYLIDEDHGFTAPFSYYTDTDGELFIQIRGDNSTDTGNYQFTLDEAVRLSPKPGPFESTVNVSMSHTVSGVTIYYTTDGATPTSTVGTPPGNTQYTGPITISSDTTILALADDGGGYSSPIYIQDYYLLNPLGALPATVLADTVLDGKERWFYFDATVGTNYTISWNDADDSTPSTTWADIVVSAYKQDMKASYFIDADLSQSESITATETGRIYIKAVNIGTTTGTSYNLNVTSP